MNGDRRLHDDIRGGKAYELGAGERPTQQRYRHIGVTVGDPPRNLVKRPRLAVQHQIDAETLRHVAGEIDLVADELARIVRIFEHIRPEIRRVHRDDQVSPLLDSPDIRRIARKILLGVQRNAEG